MITCISPTGDRELAFSLCKKWMSNQTVKPDQWIIVDDGAVPISGEMSEEYIHYIRREPKSTDPKCTLLVNLKEAIPFIKGDKIFIIEDDEYYAPNYIEEMSKQLDSYEVVGIGKAKYYHLPTGKYDIDKNMDHASLAETGFRSSFLPEFANCIEKTNGFWLDVQIWKRVFDPRNQIKGLVFVDGDSLYLGMKGLPGRKGIGIGHNPYSYRKNVDDTGRTQLKKWVPNDYQIYLDILK
jgi:hypothetical protein